MKKNLELFLNFFKIGLFTFGGGYAMISHIKDFVVNQKNWITDDELLEMIAISETTPGPIAINLATFIGYRRNKILGSIFSTLGVVLPSFIIIYIISLFFNDLLKNNIVNYAFQGIKCAVAFLIVKAGIGMFKKLSKHWYNYAMLTVIILLMIVFEILSVKISSIILILCGGLIGFIVFSNSKNKEESKQ